MAWRRQGPALAGEPDWGGYDGASTGPAICHTSRGGALPGHVPCPANPVLPERFIP